MGLSPLATDDQGIVTRDSISNITLNFTNKPIRFSIINTTYYKKTLQKK